MNELKNFIAVLPLVLFSQVLSAQQTFPSDVWHEGRIVLLEGDTLKGLVKYDMQNDLVQHIVHEKKAEVYTARKIAFFEIFDASAHRYRQFFTLPYNASGGYKTPVFFELLEEGKLTLLSRELMENRTYSSPYYVGSYSRLVLVYKYFFLDEKGDINEFTGNRNDLLNMMGKKGDDVEKYIRRNRLKFDDKYDFAKIIAYYNTLVGS
jgi:hypothetical protein